MSYHHIRFVQSVLGALGRGIGSESPLVHVIEKVGASTVYVLVTKESLTRWKDFKEWLGEKFDQIKIIPIFIDDPENPIAILKILENHVKRVDVVDITAGTKPMAAALFVYALRNADRVAYVTGKRDPETGRVLTGTEEVKIFEVATMGKDLFDKR